MRRATITVREVGRAFSEVKMELLWHDTSTLLVY